MVTSRTTHEGDSSIASKAFWDDYLTRIFCELCIKEVDAGNRPTTHLNAKGWENVTTTFIARTGKSYGKPQLKNRWDTLKKEWRLWNNLLNKASGIEWCPIKKTLDATEEWWAQIIQVRITNIYSFNVLGFSDLKKFITFSFHFDICRRLRK